MVRNVSSKQSLRDSMAGTNVFNFDPATYTPESFEQSVRSAIAASSHNAIMTMTPDAIARTLQAQQGTRRMRGVECSSCKASGTQVWFKVGDKCPLCQKPAQQNQDVVNYQVGISKSDQGNMDFKLTQEEMEMMRDLKLDSAANASSLIPASATTPEYINGLLQAHQGKRRVAGKMCSTCAKSDRKIILLPGHRCPICQQAVQPDQESVSYEVEMTQTDQKNMVKLRNFKLASNDEALRFPQATKENAAKYTKPFCDFLTDNPTVFHAVDDMKKDLKEHGYTELSERKSWDIKPSGKYFVERNGSSLIAFAVGANYEPGNGAAILAGHVDALTAKLKPVSQVPNKAGYLQLGVAPYAGGLGHTWWDRDLGVGGRVHIKEGDKIITKLVKLDWPIAKIPSLAEHFGAPAAGPFNKETQMVPIIGLDSSDSQSKMVEPYVEPFSQPSLLGRADGSVGSFISTQPPALVSAIATALGLSTNSYANIVNWELELFDVQPATVAGLNKEFISAGRIDDKLCSWSALQALIESESDISDSSILKVVGLFDDEEIGSLLRQGAKGNFLPITLERAVGSLAGHKPDSDIMGRTYANSFMVSSDVTHAVNPNFLGVYLENHAPHLNVGITVAADSNGHMTTDSVSTTILKRCADKVGAQLQVFQIRNDSRSGGTVGPMLSSALGVRAIDAGLAQLSMHSIRATTGALDPGLGVIMFLGFLNGFEAVDKEMQDS